MSDRARPLALLVALAATAAATSCGRSPARVAPVGAGTPSPSGPASPADISYFPLAVGHRWTYAQTEEAAPDAPAVESELVVEVTDHDQRGYRLTESRAGRTVRNYLVRKEVDGFKSSEYEVSREDLRVLPAQLPAGSQWDLADGWRGDVVRERGFELGGRTVRCLELLYQRRFPGNDADPPGWYDHGIVWVASGIGIVRRDMRLGPPWNRTRSRRPTGDLRVLKSFTPAAR
jgi:hypothetical protein